MKIRFGNCILSPTEGSPTQWDLFLERVVPEKNEKGVPNKHAGETLVTPLSWGVRLPFAVDEIVHQNVHLSDVETDYKTFLAEYKRVYEEFNQTIVELIKNMKNENV